MTEQSNMFLVNEELSQIIDEAYLGLSENADEINWMAALAAEAIAHHNDMAQDWHQISEIPNVRAEAVRRTAAAVHTLLYGTE